MTYKNVKFSAPLKGGAIFLLSLLCAIGCQKKSQGSASAENVLPTIEQAVANLETQAAPAVTQSINTQPAAAPVAADATATSTPTGLRFVGYNVANWLILDERYDFDTRISEKNAPKPEKEKAAVVSIVSAEKPDVFGVCEIGTKDDLIDIQTRLKAAGVDLPHLHYSGGMDTTRHLGLLSRFPIVSTAVVADQKYKINGKEYGMQRGVLDATVKTPDGRLWRFLGVHLKSKRDVEDGDQNQMRINEAQLLRKHIDEILKADPQARLINYGDFNDTRRTSPLKIIQGPYNSPRGMNPIGLHDSRHEYWTHFWEREDVYSRFDYIMFSQALKKDVVFEECKILDPKNWRMGSDHRAVMAVFR